MSESIVIVGAGECGTRAAFALREQGFAGEVILVSEEHHLPYERPPLSKQAMVDDKPEPKYIASAAQFDEANIELKLWQKVTALQPAEQTLTLEANGKSSTLPYSKLLLTTGSSPRTLPLFTQIGIDCSYLRTLGDAEKIRTALQTIKHVVIIGGGLIGLELAASARKLGVEVTVLEADSRVLRRAIPESIAEVIVKRHQAAGVNIICNAAIQRVSQDAKQINFVLNNGVQLSAELVVVGIGAIPNTHLAEQAGLEVKDGIVVNEHLQTSDPHIYAAGDCCAFPHAQSGQSMRLETWRNAQQQGNLAATNLMGAQTPHTAVPWFWSDQYELGLQVAGLASADHQRVVRQLNEDSFIEFELDNEGHLVMAAGIGIATAVAKDIRVAEMLIAKQAKIEPNLLADAAVNLKKLLK
ncbi:MAG TPA: FAD-dependent oxidoreductase [Thiolinea sp.]|nr:FAD-dependent oxidoreductase [Thiolinea sp.]